MRAVVTGIGTTLLMAALMVVSLIPAPLGAQEAMTASDPAPQALPEDGAPMRGLQDRDELEAFLDGLMLAQMTDKNVAGATVSVVKDGEVFFAKGYGYADVAARKPVDPERTLFRIGSISKLFTWTAVMQLVEQGRIDLDEDVNTYLDFEIPAAYGQPITMRHFLTHTPGPRGGQPGPLHHRPGPSHPHGRVAPRPHARAGPAPGHVLELLQLGDGGGRLHRGASVRHVL